MYTLPKLWYICILPNLWLIHINTISGLRPIEHIQIAEEGGMKRAFPGVRMVGMCLMKWFLWGYDRKYFCFL